MTRVSNLHDDCMLTAARFARVGEAVGVVVEKIVAITRIITGSGAARP